MRSILVVIVLTACSSGTKPAPTPPTGSGSSEPAASHTSCTEDADCVVVETACCDHCNGGKAEAFNIAFANQHRPSGCEGTACTQRGCGDALPTCEAGTCTVTIAPL